MILMMCQREPRDVRYTVSTVSKLDVYALDFTADGVFSIIRTFVDFGSYFKSRIEQKKNNSAERFSRNLHLNCMIAACIHNHNYVCRKEKEKERKIIGNILKN